MYMRHNKRALAFLIATAFLVGTAVPAFASTEEVRVGANGFLGSSQSKDLSRHLEQVLSGITAADTDLKKHQVGEAKRVLVQAQKTVKNLRDRYGYGTASVFISNKHKTLNGHATDAENELNMRSFHELDDAQAALSEGRFEEVEKTIDTIDYPLVFASIDVPLSQTEISLDEAIALINKGKPEKAGQVLEMAQVDVDTSSGLFGGHFNVD
jgi:hypothetical protein